MTAPVSATTQLACPQCRAQLNAQDTICPACGANIALVTLLAEQQLVEFTRGGAAHTAPTSVEQLVPRLGEYLIAQGHLTDAQLQSALTRKNAGGPGRLLGQVLVEMGALTREDLDRVIARQILELQQALLQANRTLEGRVAERTAELETALRKLNELNQLKANIVANISHELRTPLTQIKGYAVLLAESMLGPLTGEQRDALKTSLEAIDRLEHLINDLISYAASARGEVTLRLQPVAVAALIESLTHRSRPLAEKKGVHFSLHLAPGLPPVLADEEKLRWVLLQLMDNAIKFTPAGGQVTLGAAREGKRVRFAVQDTGIGIPAQRLPEIFDDFRQLDGSATRRYGGTGLGLALVRRVVDAHGAQIHVDSHECQGSLFSFTLPQADETTPAAKWSGDHA
jgi:signal transduction histidine kinase